MTLFVKCFRQMLVCWLIVSQINAERNYTQMGPLFVVRQMADPRLNWESPNSKPTMNHAWKNNDIGGGAAAAAVTQQQHLLQSSNSNNIADTIASSILRFAINVGSELSENAYFSKSEVFSPVSIMSALALLFAGAKGKSYQQLKPIFGYDLNTALINQPNYAQLLHQEFGFLLQDITQDNIGQMHRRQLAKWRETPERANIRSMPLTQQPIVHIIKVANGLFAQTGYNLNPNYKDVVRTIYNSELVSLDFQNNGEAARQHINTWVDQSTFGRIKNVIQNSIPQSTNMILASVLYFKGFWENTFFPEATILDNFYPEGEGKPAIKVKMMATAGVFPYYEAPEYDCRIIGLPYRGNLSTMYVIQPKQSSRANLKDFQSKITPEAIEDMISKMAYRSAVMAFPKLHIVRQLNLKDILQNFGVLDIFSSSASDLSLVGGVGSKPLPPNINAGQISRAPEAISVHPRPWHAQQPTAPNTQAVRPVFMDRYNEAPLFFSSRFGEIGNATASTPNNQTTKDTNMNATATKDAAKTTPESQASPSTTTTTTPMPPPMSKNETKLASRQKRQALTSNLRALDLLEAERLIESSGQSDLYVADILHKVDFEVNEQGTEAAAATLTYLKRSGTDVIFRCDTPFMLLLRHDPTKLVLFYATVNEPEI